MNNVVSVDDLLTRIQPMSLAELEKTTDGSIYVINKTNPLGPILIELKNGTGGTETVSIPGSWCPFDMTTVSMKNDLMETPMFRRLVTMRSIVLVPAALAEEILATPEGLEEQQKIYKTSSFIVHEPNALLDVESAPNEEIGPVAINLVESNKHDEKAMMAALRLNAASFTQTEFQYIAENAPFAKVKEYCASKALRKV